VDAGGWVTATEDGASTDDPHVFEFNITGDFSLEGTKTASFGGDYKEVRLVGIKTISLDPAGPKGSLIRTAANQRLVIDGPTLAGRTDNDAALVYITGSNSAPELHGGEIKDNANTITNANGGGVYNSGTFTMSGGTISGNTADCGGSGVFVDSYDVTFTKTGGIIYGDSDSDPDNGFTTDNTATDATNPGTNGHAVLYAAGSYPDYTTYYYRNETLTGADNISTTDLTTNWTQRP
jgi:hypothetical protein